MSKVMTMVSRAGTNSMPASQQVFSLIGPDYNISSCPGNQLTKLIMSGQITVTNMTVDKDKGLVTTNGAMNNYKLFNTTTGEVESNKAVVLERIEKDNKLIGYVIFGVEGIIRKVSLVEAVKIAKQYGFSNGKLRDTEEYGTIVSSINGVYPLMTLKSIKKFENAASKLNMKIVFTGVVMGDNGKACSHMAVMISSSDAMAMSSEYKKLKEMNSDLIADMKELRKADDDKQIEQIYSIVSVSGAALYGVFREKDILEYMSGANKVSVGEGVTINCLDADDTESVINLDGKLNIVDKKQGSTEGDKVLYNFVKNVVPKIKSIIK